MSKSVIESFTLATGWTLSTGVTATVNQVPDYIAGLNASSLIVGFPASGIDKYITKDVTIDVSDYTELSFWIWSRNKKNTGIDYQLSTDFQYKLDLGDGHIYYIPVYSTWNYVTIDISDISSISRIRFIANHNDEDYLILSYMVATKDEIPLDIFQGIKEQLEYDINNFYSKISAGVASKGILLGTITASAGAKSIILSAPVDYLQKYSDIRIDDGTNSDTHQIDEYDDKVCKFSSMYSGAVLLNNFAAGSVYLTFPVGFGMSERDIMLPGIAIWGMAPEEIIRGNKQDTFRDTFKVGETVQSRITQSIYKYEIMIDCEARENEMIAYMSQIVRAMIAREHTWINGKRVDIVNGGPSVFIDPVQGYNMIPKIQYLMSMEVKEETYDRETLVKTVTNNLEVDISEDLL